jgi:hypothetical protein
MAAEELPPAAMRVKCVELEDEGADDGGDGDVTETGTEDERVSPLPSCPSRNVQIEGCRRAKYTGAGALSPERPRPNARTTEG